MPFQIIRTAPTVYLDQTGSAINGFKVTVYLPDFDETHFINVEALNPDLVKSAAMELYNNRVSLAALGELKEETKGK